MKNAVDCGRITVPEHLSDCQPELLKAKFHYAIWFEPCFEPASKQIM